MFVRPRYAIATILLLLAETGIALFLRDPLIRPHVGDSLAVTLVYCGLRAGTRARVRPAVTIALIVATMIEIGQRFGAVDRLGFGTWPIARVVLGTGFDPWDFSAYAAGGALVLVVETVRRAGITPGPAPAGSACRRGRSAPLPARPTPRDAGDARAASRASPPQSRH